jgi:hypothetical protein
MPCALLPQADLGCSGEFLADAKLCPLLPRMDLGCSRGVLASEQSCSLLAQKTLGCSGTEPLVRSPYWRFVTRAGKFD